MKLNNAITGLKGLLNEYHQEFSDRQDVYEKDFETLDDTIKLLSSIKENKRLIDRLYQLLDETELEADFEDVYKDGHKGINYTIELLESIG